MIMNEAPVQIHAEEWKAHEYVLIKRKKRAGDSRYINNKSVIQPVGGADASVLTGEAQWATLERMILGWNLTETVEQPDGSTIEQSIPFDGNDISGSIERLDEDYYNAIFIEIIKRSGNLTEEQQKAFLTSATNGSRESQTPSPMPL
jgi:hypothetical protein